jgi:hypothetical protein
MKYIKPKSTANFLEPGRNGCELRVASCEVKSCSVYFLAQLFKVLPRIPATRNPAADSRSFLTVDLGKLTALTKKTKKIIIQY